MEVKEQLPEEFFREVAKQSSDRMMAELPSEEYLAQQLSFSPGFEQRMQELFANPNPARAQKRRVTRVLAIAAAIAILLISSLMSVSAVRQAVFTFFTELYENHIVAWFEPDSAELSAPETILEFREPADIPAGYARAVADQADLLYAVSYINAEGTELMFEQTILNSVQYALDIEAEADEHLFAINGTSGICRVKNDMLDVVWTDNEYAYRIYGYIEKAQALLMAHSTK